MRTHRYYVPLLLALCALLVAFTVLLKADHLADPLTGIVTDEAGKPLPGIFVKAHGPNAMTTTAVTDDSGRFVLSADVVDLSQRLTVHGSGFEEAVHEAPRAGTEINFALRRHNDPYEQAVSAQFLALLPDGEEKRQFILDCTGCHQFDRTIIEFEGHLKSQAKWQERIEQMISFSGGHSNFPVMAPSRDAALTATWLVTHLGGPDDPRPTLEPSQLPASSGDVVITEYPIPAPQDLPHDLYPMADGQILITGMMTHQMYTLNPESGAFETHAIPVQYANPRALSIDDNGTWWVLLGYPRKIASYTPATDTWKDYDIGMYPHSIVLDEGKVWFNGHFTKSPELIGYLDIAKGDVKTYEVPTPAMPDGGSTIPYGLRRAPDGTLWATQLVGNRLIRFEPNTEQFTLYDLPTTHSGPRRPDIGPDGIVWVPEYAGGKLARFDPATETFTEYPLPIADALPYIVRVDPGTGHIWVATAAADAVFRFAPATETFATYRLPTHRALIRHMEIEPKTGAVWVAYGNSPATSPKVARLALVSE